MVGSCASPPSRVKQLPQLSPGFRPPRLELLAFPGTAPAPSQLFVAVRQEAFQEDRDGKEGEKKRRPSQWQEHPSLVFP